MAIVGGLLAERKHPAAPFILWAALIFAISVTFRSLDLALCDAYQLQGRGIGTHFVWHLLNALVLSFCSGRVLRSAHAGRQGS